MLHTEYNQYIFFLTTLLFTTVQLTQPVNLMVSSNASVKNSDQCLHSCCWIRSRGHSLLSRLGDAVVRDFGIYNQYKTRIISLNKGINHQGSTNCHQVSTLLMMLLLCEIYQVLYELCFGLCVTKYSQLLCISAMFHLTRKHYNNKN
jgi:hypothetical protein